jgi:hypothetical protein
MTEPRHLRSYVFIDRPYAQVRACLRRQTLDVLQRATNSAAARGEELVTSLTLALDGVEVAVDARIYVHRIREEEGVAGLAPVTVIEVGWEGKRAPALFPTMRAELSAWPLTADETQLELTGSYSPPLGIMGSLADAAALHRVAEAVVQRFLEDIARELRRELPPLETGAAVGTERAGGS